MQTRNHRIDQIKGLACLLIVAHHLAFYGPMADQVWPAAPAVMSWLYEYARMAVQIFLVLAGYFCAAALAPTGCASGSFSLRAVLLKRYLRLCLPFCAAILMAIGVNELVRHTGFNHESVSAEPTFQQVIAHLLLLHSVGGWESLSAGVWYVAIDFQLYALCATWIWLAHQHGRSPESAAVLTQLGVLSLTIASLWWWNRNSSLDVWVIYFVGAYGLGMMAWWCRHAQHAFQRHVWIALILTVSCFSLWLEWRARIALAALTAMLLALSEQLPYAGRLEHWRFSPLSWLGVRSYSVFLIHFPVCLLINALWSTWWPSGVTMNALGMCVALLLSVTAGELLYATVESRAVSWPKLLSWQAGTLGLCALAVFDWI